jgi:outer membrane receptor protein involved in Fe transport
LVSNTAFGPGVITDYAGFDPLSAPNNGQGFDKDLGGNELPNAPPFTISAGAQYTVPLSSDWAGTLRGDYYWQDYSWARVFNDRPYDRLRGYTNLNLTLILTNQNGWQVMLYDKNVFNTTAITGDFLNSDDSGLTTNVFLTDPKLIGVRVTKNW